MPMRARLTGGTPRTRPIETTRSTSLIKDLSVSSLRRRVPSFFCCASNSVTCSAVRRPSSTSASAMRSPNVFTGGISAVHLLQNFRELDRRHQIENEAAFGGGFHLAHNLFVVGIAGGDHHGLAELVERQHRPAQTNVAREG